MCQKLKKTDFCNSFPKFFPNSGQVPSVAEKNFLAKVRGLDMYGVDPHPCKVRGIKFQEIILIYSFNLHLEWETNIIEMLLENDPLF